MNDEVHQPEVVWVLEDLQASAALDLLLFLAHGVISVGDFCALQLVLGHL